MIRQNHIIISHSLTQHSLPPTPNKNHSPMSSVCVSCLCCIFKKNQESNQTLNGSWRSYIVGCMSVWFFFLSFFLWMNGQFGNVMCTRESGQLTSNDQRPAIRLHRRPIRWACLAHTFVLSRPWVQSRVFPHEESVASGPSNPGEGVVLKVPAANTRSVWGTTQGRRLTLVCVR